MKNGRGRIWIGIVALTLIGGAWLLREALVESSTFHPLTREVESEGPVASASILFMGDVMLARSIGAAIRSGKDPFADLRPRIDEFTLRVANVECAIADPKLGSREAKPYAFNAPVEAVEALAQARIDVAVLANNHIRDFGQAATVDTVRRLRAAGIKTVGAGANLEEAFAPLVIDLPLRAEAADQILGRVKVAFLAVNDVETKIANARPDGAGAAYFEKSRIAEAIRSAREAGASIVFVIPHWGVEYSPVPSERQRIWSRAFMELGADAVVGSHPHVPQAIEPAGAGFVAFSLGNLVFDGMSGPALDGVMVGVRISVKPGGQGRPDTANPTATLASPQTIPIRIDDRGFPRLVRKTPDPRKKDIE